MSSVKIFVARHSLQALNSGHIITPLDVLEWAKCKISGIKLLFVVISELFKLFQAPDHTIAWLRPAQTKLPSSNFSNVMKMAQLWCRCVYVVSNLHSDQFVAVVYGADWYIGCSTEYSIEFKAFWWSSCVKKQI